LKSLKCGEPNISIIVKPNSTFEILGSNQLSSIGIQLYTYTNNSSLQSEIKLVIPSYSDDFPQLCLHGMVPYRYISVRAISGSVLISGLSFSFNNCDKDEH